MTTYYRLNNESVLTDEEKQEIRKAKEMPIVYDEDSPKMTNEMKQAFIHARREKPYNGQAITIVVSNATFEKAEKTFGADYSVALGRLLDKAVKEYVG